jgi:hypothetical protein
MLVIGASRASTQDLRRWVGIVSRLQVESEEAKMAFRTSSGVAGTREVREGGVVGGKICGDCEVVLAKLEDNLEILFSKKFRNAVVRSVKENPKGRDCGSLRESKVLRVFQSW